MDLATARTRATLSVPEAGELLGLGRDAAYAAAGRDEIPTLRFGRRRVVPVATFLRLLGVDDAPTNSSGPTTGFDTEDHPEDEAGVSHAGLGNVVTLTQGARRERSSPPASP